MTCPDTYLVWLFRTDAQTIDCLLESEVQSSSAPPRLAPSTPDEGRAGFRFGCANVTQWNRAAVQWLLASELPTRVFLEPHLTAQVDLGQVG